MSALLAKDDEVDFDLIDCHIVLVMDVTVVFDGFKALDIDTFKVHFNDLRVVIGGLTGVLLVSGDAGETFRLTQQDDRKGVSAVVPGPNGAVVVAGEGGVRVIRLDSTREGS